LAQKVENTSVRPSVLHTNPISCAQRRVLPTHPLVKLRLMRGPTINMKPIEPEGLRILADPRPKPCSGWDMYVYVCVCTQPTRCTLTKTLTVRDEVYRKLLTVKKRDESFSRLFERLVENMSALETLKKLRGCAEFKDKEEMLSEIRALRTERRL